MRKPRQVWGPAEVFDPDCAGSQSGSTWGELAEMRRDPVLQRVGLIGAFQALLRARHSLPPDLADFFSTR